MPGFGAKDNGVDDRGSAVFAERESKMIVRTTIALLLLAAPIAAVGQTLQCTITDKVQCDPGGQCKSLMPTVQPSVDLDAKRYSRCDRGGCDTFDVQITRSGAFTIIEAPGRSMFLKIGPGGKSTEVVSLMNSVLVSNGICHRSDR